MGIHADPDVDFGEMVDWKDDIVEQLTGGVEKLCKANGVDLLEGTATFVDENTVRVSHDGDGQGSETVSFEHAIVATGSRPIEIPNFSYADEPVLNSRQALALESVPDSLVIVGAGYIGMELASVFAKLGTDVTVIEMRDSILPGYDDDLTRPVRQRADDLGIEFEFGYTASEWHEHGDDGGIRVLAERAATDGGVAAGETTDTGDALSLEADSVLVAVGREPVSDTPDLAAAGVETDERGFVETDSQARTSTEHIFAVGDVAGEPMLAHKAVRRCSRRRSYRRRARGDRPPGDTRRRLYRSRDRDDRAERGGGHRLRLRDGYRAVPVPGQRSRADDRRVGRVRHGRRRRRGGLRTRREHRRARGLRTDRRTRPRDRTRRDTRGRRLDGSCSPDAVGVGDGSGRERTRGSDPHTEPVTESVVRRFGAGRSSFSLIPRIQGQL